MIEQSNDWVIAIKGNQKSLHRRLYVISADWSTVSVYHHAEPGHQLHWVRDGVFGEDDCRLKLAPASANWGVIRT